MLELVIIGAACAIAGIGLGVFGHSSLIKSMLTKLPANAQTDVAALQEAVKALKAKVGL